MKRMICLVPDVLNDGALEKQRKTSDKQWMVVNRYETEKGDVFVKRQCMHCYQAACATACPTEAMKKTMNGPVTWDGDKCIGCRFCMISCPFDIPKFEYNEWNPKMQKCTMCFERLEAGQKPACVAACPTDACMFGTQVRTWKLPGIAFTAIRTNMFTRFTASTKSAAPGRSTCRQCHLTRSGSEPISVEPPIPSTRENFSTRSR